MLTTFILAILATEALTEILVDSVLLERSRVWLGGDGDPPTTLRGIFVRCGFCVSVWVGCFFAYLFWMAPLPADYCPVILQPAVSGLIVHRLAVVWHDITRRIRGL